MCLLVISKCQDHGGTTNLKECVQKFDALQAVSVPRVCDYFIQTVPHSTVLANCIAL